MSKPALNKKIRISLSMVLFFGSLNTLITDFPVGFPEKSELQYSTGIFDTERSLRATNHVSLTNIDGSNEYKVFSCSYSPFSNQRSSSCGDVKNLEPYMNKEVTIGWYQVKPFLGFKNEIPQLVTIDIDGETMRSYEHTAVKVARKRHGRIYVLAPIYLLFVLLCYWFLGKIR